MDERYLTSFEDQTTALDYTSGTTLVSPQVSLVGADEVVYSKKIPNESKIRFAKDETTGKLYFIIDGVYYDAITLRKAKMPLITYGEVDLGLPNGTIWADRNVGAKTPQDYGVYFSWGSTSGVSISGTDKWLEDDLLRIYLIAQQGIPAETITQEMIDAVKLQFGDNIKTIIENYLTEYSLISGTTFDWENTPYCTVDEDGNPVFSKYNGTDGLTVLEAIDDAVTVNMGSDWRMPTVDETDELVQNTVHYYIGEDGSIVGPFNYETSGSDKGLDRYKKLRSICFVKKSEGFNYNDRSNFIEFPFAGYCYGSLFGGDGLYGNVWSSSVVDGNMESARGLDFDSDGYLFGGGEFDADHYDNYRCYGRSVRGVRVIRVYYDITELVKKSIPVPSEGYGEVDLGLPNGTIWADRNVGAETPQDNGAYFSWGNVEGVVSNGTTKKSEDYLIEQIIIANLGGEGTPEQIEEVKNNPDMMRQINAMIPMVTGLISGYSFDENTYSTTLGGQYTGSTLDAEHDAATVNMGSDWRMPTSAETLELVENTDHYYIDLNGNKVAGPFDHTTNFTDKGLGGSNLRSICFVKKGDPFDYNNRSNFIEFPFAGGCGDSMLVSEGFHGLVWSSFVSEIHTEDAYCLDFDGDGYLDGDYESHERFNGLSVRGVHT